jgi:hypothetical protein
MGGVSYPAAALNAVPSIDYSVDEYWSYLGAEFYQLVSGEGGHVLHGSPI